ncbi:hypothetical protein SIAM614_27722 [Stappia aggregata IAM 12614]
AATAAKPHRCKVTSSRTVPEGQTKSGARKGAAFVRSVATKIAAIPPDAGNSKDLRLQNCRKIARKFAKIETTDSLDLRP